MPRKQNRSKPHQLPVQSKDQAKAISLLVSKEPTAQSTAYIPTIPATNAPYLITPANPNEKPISVKLLDAIDAPKWKHIGVVVCVIVVPICGLVIGATWWLSEKFSKADAMYSQIDSKIETSMAVKLKDIEKSNSEKLKELQDANKRYEELLYLKDRMYFSNCSHRYEDAIIDYKREYSRIVDKKDVNPSLESSIHESLLAAYVNKRRYSGITETEVEFINKAIEQDLSTAGCSNIFNFYLAELYLVVGNCAKARRFLNTFYEGAYTMSASSGEPALGGEIIGIDNTHSPSYIFDEYHSLSILIELADESNVGPDRKSDSAWNAMVVAFGKMKGTTAGVNVALQTNPVLFSVGKHIRQSRPDVIEASMQKILDRLNDNEVVVEWKYEEKMVGERRIRVPKSVSTVTSKRKPPSTLPKDPPKIMDDKQFPTSLCKCC